MALLPGLRLAGLGWNSVVSRVPGLGLRVSSAFSSSSVPSDGKGDDKDGADTSERSPKYKLFRDDEAQVILDVEEEREAAQRQPVPETPADDLQSHRFKGLNLQRGVRGVFDIEDLVEVLKREKAEDVCVVRLPENLRYVDYMVVATARSDRHIRAVAEFVRRLYKEKRHRSDTMPTIEGAHSHWIAMDLGNIALHVMSAKVREKYDLEGLWSLGPEYDIKKNENQEDELMELLKKHSISLDDFNPANKLG